MTSDETAAPVEMVVELTRDRGHATKLKAPNKVGAEPTLQTPATRRSAATRFDLRNDGGRQATVGAANPTGRGAKSSKQRERR